MSQTDKESPVVLESEKKDGKKKVAEYLASPRKKRKRYVILALGSSVPYELQANIEQFVRVNFKNYAIAMPKTVDELQKSFSRQIVLMVYDDEFVPLADGLEMCGELKRRKVQSAMPILFMTRRPSELIASYNQKLAAYHETDDYLYYPKMDLNLLFSRLRYGLTANNQRRSRRYRIDIPLDYYLLSDDQMHKGRLIDLSVHGALLRAEDGHIFRTGEQLKLHLPIAAYLPITAGDYLKLSARVRRIYIIGNQVGISFEYISEDKLLTLTRYLTTLVNLQNNKRSQALKARAATLRGA